MCGINGVFAYRDTAPPVDETELLKVRDAMAKRGPDGAGLWISPDRRVGLGHRRLSIIDLSDAGAQPMTTADGRLHVTFNGEIYNYKALRKELEQKGFVFRSQSDTEVILHLYADRGADMVHALRGMYALGIWDEREKALFLARDPFGIKPLYYSDNGESLRFASQVKALLAGSAIARDINPAGHVGFLLFGAVPEPHTLFRQIYALPAGSTMWVRSGKVAPPSRFFDVAMEFLTARENPSTVASATQALQTSLAESVRAHLVADVEVGLFLSGGVDSTMVAQLATSTNSGVMRALTLGFREFGDQIDDEVPLAQSTAKELQIVNEIGWIGSADFEAELPNILQAMDQPSIDGVNTYFVSKLAAQVGLKVALSGVGGDEFFAGYPSFRQVPWIVRAASCFPAREQVGLAVRRMTASLFKAIGSPKYAGLIEYGGTPSGAYLLRRALFAPWELESVLGSALAREGIEQLDVVKSIERLASGTLDDYQTVACFEAGWYMKNQLLRDADWASMAHSIEVRVPFVDVPVLRAIAGCSAAGVTLDKALQISGFAAGPVRRTLKRRKTGFSIPVVRWANKLLGTAHIARGYHGWGRYLYGQFAGHG